MLNYIKAELFKVVHRKYFWIFLAVMLALESFFALAWAGFDDFALLTAAMTTTMPIGSFLAILLADVVVSEPLKTGTIKNEISFGLTRSRIYLGKLFAAILVAVLFCAILFGWYLGGGWLLTARPDPEATRTNLAVLGCVTAASLPLWLGTLGLSAALFMTLKSEAAGLMAVFCFLTVGVGVLGLLSLMTYDPIAKAAKLLLDWMPVIGLEQFKGPLTGQLMMKNWCIGLSWLAGSTLAGLSVFRRREIK